ncbi:MAG: rRNA methyltransferase [Pseudobdellovibrio sp.]|jgi:TrmH family RNA methyltransferase|nr:rRNA methyltransferase [Pseudobdellovibrio sp.]
MNAKTSSITQISSSTNSLFRQWQSLLTAKGIKEHKQFFLMGEKLVNEFLQSPVNRFKAEYLVFKEDPGIKTSARKTALSKELFDELDVLNTKSPLLILSYEEFPEKNFSAEPTGLELVCPLGDPRNLGALMRTAVAFGANELVLTKESAHPFLPHAIKASAGAALNLKITKSSLSLGEIPLNGANYALDLHGESLLTARWPKNLRLWVGEEGPGLSLKHEQKKVMKFINIPTSQVESLNAMVSTSLALWEWKKQNEK